MARTKKTLVSGVSREQAEQAFADFAAADAQVQNLTSKMDIEMTVSAKVCRTAGRTLRREGRSL